MTATRRSLALSAAALALAGAVPAAAHPGDHYEYAHPAPDGPVVFDSEPVVQPLPHDATHDSSMAEDEFYEREVVEEHHSAHAAPHAMPHAMPHHPMGSAHAAGAYAAPYPSYGHAGPPQFDRDAWLAQCNDRIRGVRRKDRAGVIGGLLGAGVGGVIGNRAWRSERLAGTLLGAGIGGLAGLAIGSAVGAAGERRREDECAWHLDRYMADYRGPGPGYGYGQPGYSYGSQGYSQAYPGYGYGGYMMVPVLVAVPQRQVVRETVTEEWVDVPVREPTVTRTRTIHRPARAPDKRIRYIKGN